MNYYYVIFASEYDYYRFAYKDLLNCANARYIYKQVDTNNELLKFIHKVHFSDVANRVVKLPFKSLWNSKIHFSSDLNDHVCFLFFTGTRKFESVNYGFAEYLRRRFPNCRLVLFYQDLVRIKQPVSIVKAKQTFDLVLSFDQGDCEKYGLIYHQLVYSSPQYQLSKPEFDVYFVGQAKNRINEIYEAYEYLVSQGLKCDFTIVRASESERKHEGSIKFRHNMPYEENIRHILNCKAMLEIMQKDGHGFTLRTCEAIAYDRFLITNNIKIHEAPYYDPNVIIQFQNPFDINADIIKASTVPYDYHYKSEISPLKLLEFIDALLV